MNAIDFMPYQEFLKIADKVKKKEDFEYEKEIRKFRINFSSGKAGCDFNSETKEGDYLISDNFDLLTGDYSGYGEPIERKQQLELFSSYINLIRFIEKEVAEVTKDFQKATDREIAAETLLGGEQLKFF